MSLGSPDHVQKLLNLSTAALGAVLLKMLADRRHRLHEISVEFGAHRDHRERGLQRLQTDFHLGHALCRITRHRAVSRSRTGAAAGWRGWCPSHRRSTRYRKGTWYRHRT